MAMRHSIDTPRNSSSLDISRDSLPQEKEEEYLWWWERFWKKGKDEEEGPCCIRSSKRQKVFGVVMIVNAAFFALLLSGLLFGWAPMEKMLIDDGVYSYLCDDDNTTTRVEEEEEEDTEQFPSGGCSQQLIRFNLIFVTSTTLFSWSLLPLGPCLDYFGPLVVNCFGSLAVFCGFLLLAFSDENFDAFLPGFIFVAFGGYSVVVSYFHLGNIFPQRRGTIITILNVSLDASSIIFLFLGLVNGNTSLEYKEIFLIYSLVPLACFLVGLILWPSRAINEEDFGHCNSFSSSVSTNDSSYLLSEQKEKEKEKNVNSFEMIDPDLPTLKYLSSAIGTVEFWLSAMFLCVNLFRVNMYIATVDQQLAGFSDDESKVSFYTTLFVIMLPCGGILSVPLVGYLIDKKGIITSLFTIGTLGVAYGTLTLLEMLPIEVQIATFSLVALFRALIFSSMTTYFFTKYGEKRFGLIFGIVAFMAGAVNLSQYFVVKFVLEDLNGQFFWVNLILTVLDVLLFSFPTYLFFKRKNSSSSSFFSSSSLIN